MATVERNRVRDTERVLTYEERYDALRETKLAQTLEKQRVIGAMDHDDWGQFHPEDQRQIVGHQRPGMPITGVLSRTFAITPSHPSGGFLAPGGRARGLIRPIPSVPLGSWRGHIVFFPPTSRSTSPRSSALAACRRVSSDLVTFFGHLHYAGQPIGLELATAGSSVTIAASTACSGILRRAQAVVLGLQNWIGRTAGGIWPRRRSTCSAPEPEEMAE